VKETIYFSHDSNAHKDPKILKLRAKFGWEGYGIYWAVIETLREQDGYRWKAEDKELLSYSFANGEAIVNEVIDYCLEIGLLIEVDGFIQSNSLIRRMEIKEEKRKKKVEAGKKGAEKRWEEKQNDSNAIAKEKQNDSNAIAKNGKEKESKVKESKVKENKGNINTSRKQVYDEDSVHFKLALRLYERILENNPDHKKPNLQKWADDIRLMMERDNRTEEQISFLIDWCQQDSFWKRNILSTGKLREKFDQLVMNVKAQREKVVSINREKHIPRAFQSLQEWAEEG